MVDIITLCYIFVGGATGATARAVLSEKYDNKTPHKIPYGTLAANSIATLMLGFLVGYFDLENVSENAQNFLNFGFCAALSTFSSLAWQLADMLKSERYLAALSYATITSGAGIILFVLGEFTMRAL